MASVRDMASPMYLIAEQVVVGPVQLQTCRLYSCMCIVRLCVYVISVYVLDMSLRHNFLYRGKEFKGQSEHVASYMHMIVQIHTHTT